MGVFESNIYVSSALVLDETTKLFSIFVLGDVFLKFIILSRYFRTEKT